MKMKKISVAPHVIRFFAILIIQGLVLKSASEAVPKLDIYVYPLFLLMLPFITPHWLILVLGFSLGIGVDAFYNTYGIHTFVCVLTAFLRPYLVFAMSPRGGVDDNHHPTIISMGKDWFFQYIGLMMLIHLFVLFLILGIGLNFDILIRIVFSFVVSMIMIIIYMFLMNPKR
jgi:hypothetical protein